MGELAEACRKHGLRLGLYYSQDLDWSDPDGGGKKNEAGLKNWGEEDWDTLLGQACELMQAAEKYNFCFYLGIGKMFYGAALYEKCDNEVNAENVIKDGYRILTESSKSSPTVMHSLYGLILGEFYRKSGNKNEFETFIDTVIQTAETHNERVYLEKLHKLKEVHNDCM